MRQIVRALMIPGFDGFNVDDRPRLRMVTMTQYDRTFPVPQAFPPFSMAKIVAEVLADHGRTQLRTAETEKYPHVTYFFNGGYEPPYKGEERALVASQKVATYDLAPEMSAAGITDTLVTALRKKSHDFLLCNFANADMVGHTGVLPAVLTAVEAALARGETDEFVRPIVLTEGGAPVGPLRDGDGVFCFNYRSDRMATRCRWSRSGPGGRSAAAAHSATSDPRCCACSASSRRPR